MNSVATPTATAGLLAERVRLETELVSARGKHKAAELRSSLAINTSMKLYYKAVELERALDAVEDALGTLGVRDLDDRPKGAERQPGHYAHNLPQRVDE